MTIKVVSIPFKRDSASQLDVVERAGDSLQIEAFPFPSNGIARLNSKENTFLTVYRRSLVSIPFKRDSASQPVKQPENPPDWYMFPFPSNGIARLNV